MNRFKSRSDTAKERIRKEVWNQIRRKLTDNKKYCGKGKIKRINKYVF